MEQQRVSNYIVDDSEVLRVHYQRGSKDYYYSIVYFLVAAFLLTLVIFFVTKLFTGEVEKNVVLLIIFFICLFFIGLYFLAVSIETIIKPSKNLFVVYHDKQQLKVKLNLLRTKTFDYSAFDAFELGISDIVVKNLRRGRMYKRQLFVINLRLVLSDGKKIKIHQFESPQLLIPSDKKARNRTLKQTSIYITNILAKACGKKVLWTKRTDKYVE